MTVATIWGAPAPDHLLSHMARVSNPTNQNNPDNSKLIGYLIRKKHWSPFDMVNLCVEIETTRDIGRQILRHWSMMMHDLKVQEFSQRYADVSELGGPVLREVRLQDTKNRQNSLINTSGELEAWWKAAQSTVWAHSAINYEMALTRGVAKEQARALLPEGMTPTRFYLNGTARQWLHYLDLRLDAGTQKEHRDVAEEVAGLFVSWAPATWRAWGTERARIAAEKLRATRAEELFEAFRFYIDASAGELIERGISREQALATARDLEAAYRHEYSE